VTFMETVLLQYLPHVWVSGTFEGTHRRGKPCRGHVGMVCTTALICRSSMRVRVAAGLQGLLAWTVANLL
jgi:hypothetical protein